MSTSQTVRRTATATDVDDQPLDRDKYAAHLEQQFEGIGEGRGRGEVTLTEDQALAIASLLDELMGVYPDEPLGRLARRAAVLLFDKAGI